DGPGECPAIRFGQRGKVAKEGRDRAVSPELREAVLARDRACLVCGRTEDLSVHHLDSHGDGGKSDMRRLATLCLSCQGKVHEGWINLRVEENGALSARDHEGNPIGKRRTAAEVLSEAGEATPLETTAIRGERPEARAARRLSEIPAEISAAQWRALE